MASLVLSLRGLRTSDIRYVTAPVARLGSGGRQSVVHLDRDPRRSPVAGVARADQVGAWATRHPDRSAPVVAR